ncbi:MAG TPA: amidohydrolase [Anaerolineaceae bacterium]|nr:amidohydrolase [Anaerolineaceae bacterium]
MIILHNAKIFVGNSTSPFKEAVAITDNKIFAIGKNKDILALKDRNTTILNMHEKTILPGFTDSHIHLHHTGKSLSMVNCETENFQQMVDRLVMRIKETKPGDWILGHGWNQNLWKNGFDEFEQLHNITKDHPIFLTAKSLHAAWANDIALRKAGIFSDTPSPEGGIISRDDNNLPNGLLFENAMEYLYQIIPPLSQSDLIKILDLTQQELWKYGITSVHDFDGVDCFSALQVMDKEKTLKIRVVKNLPVSAIESIIQTGLQTGFGSQFLKIGSIKLFSDGAMGPQTAAMLSPYENNSQNLGMLLLTKEKVKEYGCRASASGLSLAIHAIGDKANREMIDAFAEIRIFEKKHKLLPQKHRIEHVQIIDDADIPRLASQRIIASMQPIHLISDMDTANHLWGFRSKNVYAFKSILEHGIKLVFGSDSPVESFNPFWGLYAAITRQKFDCSPQGGWYPEQKISLLDAMNAYTINPAQISNWNGLIGSLKPGKYADLTIVPENPFEIEPEAIKDMLPIATMVAGEMVFQREEI